MIRMRSLKSLVLGVLILTVGVLSRVEAQPTEEQLKAFRNVKVVQLVVWQDYGEAEGVNLPFEKVARKFLEAAGFKVVGSDAQVYDATLRIKVVGEALGASCTAGYHYSGAEIDVKISFEVAGVPAYIKSFKETKSPSYRIYGWGCGYPSPSDAPFNTVFGSLDYCYKLAKLVEELYGVEAVEPLIAALKDKDSDVRESAAEALVKIGDPKAIEPLKEVAKNDSNSNVRKAAKEALEKIQEKQ